MDETLDDERNSPTLLYSLFHTILITTTSVLTTTTLVGLIVLILIINAQKIFGIIIAFVMQKILGIT